MVSTERSEVERFNNLVFVAIVVALLLSFVDDVQIAFVVEVVARVAVIGLVLYGLANFRRDYFSHWTSWLTLVLAAVSLLRLVQLSILG